MSFLLAPVGRANNGLTLVNAVNVFLLEQPACAAVELQCVNRVHRVGQTRPTTVYRYVVKDTIEDAIYEYHRTHTASVEEDGGRRRSRPALSAVEGRKSRFIRRHDV